MKKPSFLILFVAAMFMLSVNVFADIITVGPGGTYDYLTIQEAIAAADPEDEIVVAAGEYEEVGQIVIDKNLTITGADKVTTIIKPAQNIENWFLVQAGTAFYLSNVTLDGEDKQIRAAIRTHGSGSIDNCIIKNIAWSTYLGWGIALTWSTSGQVWNITNNDFLNIERVGILVDGAGNQATIYGNTFIGKEDGDWVGYGVEVGDGAYALIDYNTIKDYRGVASSDGSVSAAILVTSYFGPNPQALVTNNNLLDNTTAIHVGYGAVDSSIVSASGNTMTNNKYQIRSKESVTFDLEHALNNNTFDRSVVVRDNPIIVPVIYSFIQDAIDAASDGNTVEVYQGVYEENLIITVDNLKLTTDEILSATIKYEETNTSSVVDIRGDGVIVENFYIERNNGASGSQAMNIRRSNVILQGLTITGANNIGTNHAIPGIMLTDGDPGGYSLPISDIIIRDNDISGDFAYGIYVTALGDGDVGVSIEDNTLYGLTYEWGGEIRPGWAIGIWDSSFVTYGGSLYVNIFQNDITGHGVYILPKALEETTYDIGIHRNRFLGSGNWAVYNQSTVMVNATSLCNWWGDASGPSVEGPGSGNAVSVYVNYDPWYIDYEMTTCSDTPLPVELSTFNAVITSNLFVQLLWTAETETNMLGYNVFRSTDEIVSNADKVNETLIAAHNGSIPVDYSYLDIDVTQGMTYYYWLQINDLDLTSQFYGPISVLVNIEEEEDIPTIPLVTKLIGAYPNPFNPGTSISFSLAETARVLISIYNSRGQFIRTLVANQEFSEGSNHSVYFDGKNDQDKSIASGVYFYIMQTNTDHREIKKMLLLK